MIQEKTEPIVFESAEDARAIRSNPTIIKVVGVGGGGCNALNRMIEAGIPDVEFIAVNTDMQCLNLSKAAVRIPIGHTVARGRGSGANPEKGRQAAEEDIDAIRAALEGANMVFITAGMGKGTGTGASPVIARIAKELGALCVAVITRPFAWEGNQVANRAAQGVASLREVVDSLIVIANDNIHRVADRKVRFSEAFQLADSVLMNGVRGISHIITTTGQMNADFSDVTRIMCEGRGHALLTMARASGENKVSELLAQVSSNPLQERRDSEIFTIDGARNCLVHISHGPDYGNWENTEIRQGIKDKLHPDAEIISSDLEDPSMADEVQIVVVATGF
ncbi:MAG: cell division protein FtsZ, partial [Spirochaetes bacterium]|nr:cell division protein FtsZ [Spirochaetota bacterium]